MVDVSGKLFVGNLSWETTNESLHSAFEGFGEIVEAAVICDRMTGRSRGFGFVTFADASVAAGAVEDMDGTELDGRVIRVDSGSRASSGGGGGGGGGGEGGPRPGASYGTGAAVAAGGATAGAAAAKQSGYVVGDVPGKLFVGNLSWDTNDDVLYNAFAEFGDIVEAVVICDRVSGRSRGFGFVTFSDEENAAAATEAMHGTELDGRVLRVDMGARPGANGESATKAAAGPAGSNYVVGDAPGKLFVGNLSWDTTDESLTEAFSAHGTISEAVVIRDRNTGRSRGFGFVTFEAPEEAAAACEALNGEELDGRVIRVDSGSRPSGGNGGGGGGGRGQNTCFTCGQPGHYARNCPSAMFQQPVQQAYYPGYPPEGYGYPAYGAPPMQPMPVMPVGMDGQVMQPVAYAGSECFKCGEYGHDSRNCPQQAFY